MLLAKNDSLVDSDTVICSVASSPLAAARVANDAPTELEISRTPELYNSITPVHNLEHKFVQTGRSANLVSISFWHQKIQVQSEGHSIL